MTSKRPFRLLISSLASPFIIEVVHLVNDKVPPSSTNVIFTSSLVLDKPFPLAIEILTPSVVEAPHAMTTDTEATSFKDLMHAL